MNNQASKNQEPAFNDNGITENNENLQQQDNKKNIKQILIAVFIVVVVLICSILVWMTIGKPDPYTADKITIYCQVDDSCCRSSYESAKRNISNIIIDKSQQCPAGYTRNQSECISSLVWCEPTENRRSMTVGNVKYPEYYKGIAIELNIDDKGVEMSSEYKVVNGYPNYYPGTYEFIAELTDNDNNVLGEYGFRDPRLIQAEMGYDGPSFVESIDFTLIIPYFENAGKINIYQKGSVKLSVDIVLNDPNVNSQDNPTIIKNEITDWRTYKNVEYGIEVQYPKNWFLDYTKKGNIQIMDKSNILPNSSVPPPPFVSISIYDNQSGLTVAEWREKEVGREIISTRQKDVMINNSVVTQYIDTVLAYNDKIETGHVPSQWEELTIYITAKDLIFVIEWVHPGVISEEYLSALTAITKSIKIDNSTIEDNWQIYKNEELGFELKYPGIWSKEGEIDFPLSLRIVSYNDLPEVLGPNDYATTPTKEDLNNLKKEINNVESGNILEIDNKRFQVVTEYSVSGGAFYRQVRFFIDNDLVELTVVLSSPQIYSWPKDRDIIEVRRKQLELGEIDEQTKTTLYQFDKLVESIKIYE